MPRESPLVRQWMLLGSLCARHQGMTVREMAEEMGGVNEKTIRRDLEAFGQAGFPLEETVCARGLKRWRIDPSKNRPGLAFYEAAALYLAGHLMEPLAGTPFWQAARRALRKIQATLGKPALDYVEQFAGMSHQTMVGRSDYTKKAEMIDRLVQAIEERRQTFITYRSLRATESVSYPVYPYGIVYHRGTLYLVGHAPDHDEIRHWKIDRVENATLEELRFQLPDGFDLHAHIAQSFGVFRGDGEVHVTIRFSPEVGRYVAGSVWHRTQKRNRSRPFSQFWRREGGVWLARLAAMDSWRKWKKLRPCLAQVAIAVHIRS